MADKRLERWVKNFANGCVKKKAYKSLGMAQSVAAKVKKERGVELHCYYCKECGCYHLTKNKSKRNIF